MSDRAVRDALDRMAAWIGDAGWEPEPAILEAWNAEYRAALATAEKDPGWAELVARAHALGQLLEVRLAGLTELRNEIKAELDVQERGNRALAGYGASTR